MARSFAHHSWKHRLVQATAGFGLFLALSGSSHANFGLPDASCSGCHASPPNLVSNSPSGTFDIGLSENWLTSDPNDLRARLKNAGVSIMETVADNPSDLGTVYSYLINKRDAKASLTAPTFPDTAINVPITRTATFTLTNYRLSSLTFTVTSQYPSRFSIGTIQSSCGNPATTIAAASSDASPRACTVTVGITFSPTAADIPAGQTSALLTSDIKIDFSYASGPSPANTSAAQTTQVSATAYRPTPILTLSPPSGSTLSMSARVNSATDSSTVTVTNTATTPTGTLTSAVAVTGNGFSLNGGNCTSPISLAPGASCTVGVRFTPTRSGTSNAASIPYTGSLSFTHNAAGSPTSLSLSGTGTQSLVSLPPTLDFGDVRKDDTRTLALTVTNSAAATATLNLTGAPQLQGTAAADYAVTSNGCTAPVAPGGSCTINLRFSPATSDGSVRSATLTVPTDAANLVGGTATVTLTGTGTAQSAPSLSAQALGFADTVLGETSAPVTVTLTNPRTGTLTYALSLPAEFTEDTPACAGRVVAANGGTCTISLRLRPQAAVGAGSRSASVPVTFTVPAGQTAPAALSLAVSGNALPPVSASPTTLAPSTTLGAATLVSSAVLNRSGSPVTLSAVAFGGPAAGDYSVDTTSACRTGVSLAAGQSCTLVLRYAPTQLGARGATLSITHTAAAGSPLALTLAGTVDIGQLSVSAGSVSFSDTALGSSAPAPTLTLRNTGSAPLSLSELTLGGSHPGDFSRSGTCALGGTLAIGAECTVTLQFQPTALGARSATLSIGHTGAAPSPVVLTLTGRGLPQPVGVLTIDAANPLDVGSQTVNGLYGARTVRLRNTGTASLQLTGVTLSGSGFSLDSTPTCAAGTTLAIDQTCDLALRFTPLAADTDYRATLTIAHSAAGSPSMLSVTGHGSAAVVPVVTWVGSTETRDFGTQAVGGAAAITHTVSLRNQGPGAIRLTLINTIGLEAAMFPVQGGAADACVAGALLEPDRTCSITLAFSPGSPGTHGARLQVVSSGTALAPLTLTGIGLGPVGGSTLAVMPERLDLGTARVGAASLPGEVVLRADAQSAVRVIGWAVDGAFVVEGRTCPAPPFTLAAGTDCTVAVRFLPTAAGDAVGTLQVTSSPGPDLAASVRSVPVAGRGESAADVVGGGGGGCSIARVSGDDTLDPTLLVLAALAALILGRRSVRHEP